MKIKSRYLLAIGLMIIMILIIGSTILRYHINPDKLYYLSKDNLIDDGSFENFNGTAGDCCNNQPGIPKLSAVKSIDAYNGNYSLELTSSNHCACISKKINNFKNSNSYLVSFYYKGDNPSTCIWISGENICKKEGGALEKTEEWKRFRSKLEFTNKSQDVLIHIYANSRDSNTYTNFYDDIQVHQLVEMNPRFYKYLENEDYVIKTDPSNVIHNGEKLNEEGYYIVTGKPDITLKFPWTELAILLFMMLVVIRLLFKKQVLKEEEKTEEHEKKLVKKDNKEDNKEMSDLKK